MITLPSVLFAESIRNIVPIWLAHSLLALAFSSRHLTNSGMLNKVQDPRIQHSHCLQTVTLWLQGTVISQQGISYQKMTFFLLVYFYFHTSVSALHRCPLACLQFHLNHIKLVSVLHTCMLQMIISHKMQDMHASHCENAQVALKAVYRTLQTHSSGALLEWFYLHILVVSRLSVLLSVTVEVISQ